LNRNVFTVYAHNRWDERNYGTKKAKNRWQTCLNVFYFHMKPALELLYARNYRNKETEKSAEVFAREAVEEFINLVGESNLNYFHKLVVAERLRSIKFVFGAPEEVFSAEGLELFYDELDLNGDEKYFETLNEILKHHRKLGNEPKQNWRRKLDEITLTYDVEYFPDDNFLREKCPSFYFNLIENVF
jgi:hypothetical protein